MGCLRKVVFLLGFAFLVLSAPAFAGPEMPDELAAEFTRYPGSTVSHSLMAQGMVQVMLACGKEPMEKVFDYYKEKSAGNGWTIMAEMKSTEGYQLVLAKNGRQAMIVITENDEGTAAVLTTHR